MLNIFHLLVGELRLQSYLGAASRDTNELELERL